MRAVGSPRVHLVSGSDSIDLMHLLFESVIRFYSSAFVALAHRASFTFWVLLTDLFCGLLKHFCVASYVGLKSRLFAFSGLFVSFEEFMHILDFCLFLDPSWQPLMHHPPQSGSVCKKRPLDN